MAEDKSDAVCAVPCAEKCPCLILLRVFRLAVGFRILALAALGLFAMSLGWWFIGSVFGHEQPGAAFLGAYARCPFEAATEGVPDCPTMLAFPHEIGAWSAEAERSNPIVHAWDVLSQPARSWVNHPHFSGLVAALLAGLWGTAVWAFFGGAITRIAVVQLACDERVRFTAALRFAARKWVAYFTAPLIPLVGVALATAPIFFLGLLMGSGFGTLLVSIVWPLALLLGLLMAMLLLGLLFGWPLMWSTISAEGSDSFDALSRSYAYVFQRPLHYLFYVVVAAVLGFLGWLLVSNFAAAVIWLSYWAAGWGCSAERLAAVMHGAGAGGAVIHFWVGCVKLLAMGFTFGYFWTAACAMYLLLRRHVDATEMDEVFLEEDEQSYGLPPLKLDSAGAPVVDDAVE